ncbi:zinc finger protein 142 isoform X1 [Mobula hypostoma]|uniref:zinc finger protein 142 isoform X1 n=1 Tax=Mobula hypostoma TaxID=723540 RepID=UPI002FC3DF9A
MEDQRGGMVDSSAVYTDFVSEQEYALHGIVELRDGPHPLQGFSADVADLVGGQCSDPPDQPGPMGVQHTVTLEMAVVSMPELPENGQGSDGRELTVLTSQQDEKVEAANQPDALIQMEGLGYYHKNNESFEHQDLIDHLQHHTVATKRPLSPSSGGEARLPAKHPRLAQKKKSVVGRDPSVQGNSATAPCVTYPCPACGQEFPQAGALKEHMGSCPSGSDVSEQLRNGCTIEPNYQACGRLFQSTTELDKHQRVHYPFCCDQCDVMCSTAKLLAEHKKCSRLRTEKFRCELCPFESCSPRDLNKHYGEKHRDKAAYVCDRCDFMSRYRKALKKHLTLHSDEGGSTTEENNEHIRRRLEPDNDSVMAQSWPGKQKPSACEEEDLVSETGSEDNTSRKSKSFRERHFKVDVQEGMEHLYKTHICPECKRCFKKRTHLVEHLHLHFPDPSLQCPHCQKFFTSKGKLKVHLMRELGVKSHHCPLCDYSAVEKNSLNRHMASMHENTTNFYSEVYACPACEEKFTVSNALKEHMKTHKEERQLLHCLEGDCGYMAEERKDLVRHLEEVHGAQVVECCYRACGSLFASEASMEAHRRTHYAFHCDQCDFVCSNKHVFRRHKRRGHPGSEELACDFCPYKTFNPVEFSDHVGKMHANEKIHKCSECDFATAHKRVLHRHVLLHTGEKPHKCELCDFTCRDMGYLSKHMLTHSDHKNYMCTECGYITKWKHYLTVHMRKHTGDLRYHCNQCSYRCHRADQLSSHKLRHQGKSLICEVCGFACKRKYELQKHMQVKHSKDYQLPLHQCQYCSYQTQYKQALLSHENCRHTRLREFRCALCPYRTFSNTSLFFHKRKTHGYVPGDKEWLENYAREEMAMNSTQNLLTYGDASVHLPGTARSKMATASSRQSSFPAAGGDINLGEGHQPHLGLAASRPDEGSQGISAPSELVCLGQHPVFPTDTERASPATSVEPGEAGTESSQIVERELQEGMSGSSSQMEEVFGAQLGFPHTPSEDVSKQVSSSQLTPLDCWAPCETSAMYRDFGLNAADVEQADVGDDDADVDEEGGEGDHVLRNPEKLGQSIDVFMDEGQDVTYELSEKTGEPGQEMNSASASGTCANVPADGGQVSTESHGVEAPEWDGSPGPENRGKVQLSPSECEIKALRKQDKQQAQALVLEGRVQMLVVQTNAQVFKCENCSYITRKERAMVLHTKSGCQNKKTPLVCGACGATFKQQRGLNTHVQKKCPVTIKKHKLYARQTGVKPPTTLPNGEGEPTAETKDVHVSLSTDPDKTAQPPCQSAGLSGIEVPPFEGGVQRLQDLEDGNTSLEQLAAAEEEQVSEKTPANASPVNGENLLPTHEEVAFADMEKSQKLGAAKFTSARGRYSCSSCPFVCSSEADMAGHMSEGSSCRPKLPCGVCGLLFCSERALKNHQAVKHAEEGEGSASEGEGSPEMPEGSDVSNEEPGAGQQCSSRRRFSCPTCAFSCCQERAMGTHQRKGCLKPGQLQCALCSFVCKSEAALEHHTRLHGIQGSRKRPRLSCHLCPFTCKQPRCLRQHVAIRHEGVKPHRCRFCDFGTTRRYRLEAHESLHTGVGRLSCDSCPRTFGTSSKLRVHKLRVHERRPTHFCALCDYSGYNRNDIARHVASCHAGQPSAACGRCPARFSSQGALKQHRLRRHRERGRHGCPSCLFACRSEATLRSHVQRRHPLLECPACKQRFPGRQQLDEHRKVHFGHHCPHCSFATRERQQLIQHLLDNHEEGEEGEEGGGAKPFRCPFCSFTCRHQMVFDYHMKGHGGTRLYKCTDCEYTTKNRQKITWHIRIHTGEKPYKCHLCAYACADPSRLKYHMRIHQEEKKYLCPECGYKCKWINQLKYHMTKHTGAKPYRCDQCDYCTNRADALRTHKETRHKEARSFICEQCGKGFKTRFLLKTHLKKHSEEKPYVCTVCHRGFRWQAGLRHHYLTHTNEHPFFCRHCSYKAKQKFQVVKHIQRHHPLKATDDLSEGVGKVPITHALAARDSGSGDPQPTLPPDPVGADSLVASS